MPDTPPPALADLHGRLLDDLDASIDKLTFGAGRAAKATGRPQAPAFRTILACLDASEQSMRALDWAGHLAKSHGARVVVASVFRPPQLDPAVAGAYALYPGLASAYGEMRDRLQDVTRSAAELLREDGIEAESVFSLGRPVHELAEITRTQGADLVILGSRSRSPLARAIGSTADALLDRVEASVLVARTRPPPARILAATDGSPASLRAAAWALAHAKAADVPVTVDHVLEYPEGSRVPADELLGDALAGMRLKVPARVTYHLDAGRPAERIVATAEHTGADLIVLGSRGLGRVRGWLLGSVSRHVASVAPASVLVVKEPPVEP